MSSEPANIRLLRETLESRLPRRDAVAVLFEALNAWGPTPPTDRADLTRLVQGPLRSALMRHMPAPDASSLLRRLEHLLVTMELPTNEIGAADAVNRAFFPDEHTTRALPSVEGAARVVVFSASDGFANHLAFTLGGWRVRITTVNTVDKLEQAHLGASSIVLVDCGLPPRVDFLRLVEALGNLPDGVWRAVWGSDLELGSNLVAALEDANVDCIPISVRSGIAPLVDLVSARAPS